MQSAPREIPDDFEEETVALPEEELADETEVKSKEEAVAEAKIKAEEEEVAASMGEIAHRTKEKASKEKASLEEGIDPLTADTEATLSSSPDRGEQSSTKSGKSEHFVAGNSQKETSINSQQTIPAKENFLEEKEDPSTKPLATPERPVTFPRPSVAPPSLVIPPKLSTPQQTEKTTVAESFSSLEVELLFVLGQQSISIQDLRFLTEEKIISLGGSDFQVSILLQNKKIAEAQLVMVDKTPSLQITKIITSS